MTKKCIKCGEVKEILSFPKRTGRTIDGTRNECKSCYSNRLSISSKKVNYINQKKYFYLKKYGITLDQYNQLLITQGNKCKICGKTFIKTPHIDHNHKTGKVRGLLCNKCNCLLGCADDNITVLNNCILYLEVEKHE